MRCIDVIVVPIFYCACHHSKLLYICYMETHCLIVVYMFSQQLLFLSLSLLLYQLCRTGHIYDELPHIHINIEYSATIFRPQVYNTTSYSTDDVIMM